VKLCIECSLYRREWYHITSNLVCICNSCYKDLIDEAKEKYRRTEIRYRPQLREEILGKLVEECGEVLAAEGKMRRWGPDSYNPELPEDEQETNIEWLLRELRDLKEAITSVEKEFKDHV